MLWVVHGGNTVLLRTKCNIVCLETKCNIVCLRPIYKDRGRRLCCSAGGSNQLLRQFSPRRGFGANLQNADPAYGLGGFEKTALRKVGLRSKTVV
jgi:hypothetical protein